MISILKYIPIALLQSKCKKRIILLLMIFCFTDFAFGQTSITLNEAIDAAVKNNLSVNNERLKTEYAKTLIKSAVNFPATQFIGEYGQINSSYLDNKASVSQSFNLPAVYNRQKELFTKEWEASLLNVSMKEYDLKRTVTQTFYNHIYLQKKEILLNSIDSLYSVLLQKANIRLQKGESNVLEKTTFETQRAGIQLQLMQLKQQILMIEEILKLLMNTDTNYIPFSEQLKMKEDEIFNLSALSEHPALKMVNQQQQISKANIEVEKSKLLPGLTLGYNNTSFQSADYTASKRFHSGQVGIGIPVFTGSQKARIKAERINEKIVANNYNIEKQALQNMYAVHIVQLQENRHLLELYQTQYLKSAGAIKGTANIQFLNGEINYLEFVMLINQAVSIENNYIDAIHEHNKIVIQLQYLTK